MDFSEAKRPNDVYGAEHLADIYGTEKDKVNCPFYWKIGACRHGERCTRNHNKPTISQTLLIPHMYPNPKTTTLMDSTGNPIIFTEEFCQQHFEDFFLDACEEFSKYGHLEEINVSDNICEHMAGNVYLKYSQEEEANRALKAIAGRYYGGRTMVPEFSPVTDFREARCRQFETSKCTREGLCNFIHLRAPKNRTKYFVEKPFSKPKSQYGGRRSPSPPPRRREHSPDRQRYRSPPRYERNDRYEPRRDNRGDNRGYYGGRDYDDRRDHRGGGYDRYDRNPPPRDYGRDNGRDNRYDRDQGRDRGSDRGGYQKRPQNDLPF
jgi:splicing factor U2AF subunit